MKYDKNCNTVSVVLPVYNNSEIINEIKEKILFITSRYNELIVIDDCSTDNTLKVLKNFHTEHNINNLIIYENKKNMGPSYSRNIGIRNAKSDYIAFLDSDDDWHPQKIEIQISIMIKYNILISGTIHKVIDKDKLETEKSIDFFKSNDIPLSTFRWPKILFITPFATPSVVIHKSLKSFLFNESMKYAEDYNLWKRITYKNTAIKILLPLTYTFKHDYLTNSNSLSSDLRKMQKGVNRSFILLLKDNKIKKFSKLSVFMALLFSQIKYIKRIILRVL